ncbi:MAG: RNA-binding S4 domain-containing protein [Erysipelotrichaceae bacterium]|nr:RNA-binding S4 domain-containing protein [Erysipelotrichaceae bacterium]MDD3923554.1 RNA-binding S4 domain-containing protein [Erysipelotrichaceae bacterium]MDD4642776.1 RNA-binding S4 domain-containing protein [Erysipelotrichaceae bacterium]
MIKINTEYITLGQLLKMTSWVASGGEVKVAIKQLKIIVNDLKEDRRGRKLYAGDIIKIQDQIYEIGK